MIMKVIPNIFNPNFLLKFTLEKLTQTIFGEVKFILIKQQMNTDLLNILTLSQATHLGKTKKWNIRSTNAYTPSKKA